ncbi:MAG: hypothetical protein JNG90_02095 [Planctomycetaceae bacterium]|nr:hypothetical protein [Planctomycetaceae bacterium]
MADLCALYLWFMGLAILGWMGWEYVKGKHDLLSFRNLYLLGFVLNQCHSPADTLWYDNWWGFKVDDKDGVALECAFLTTVYMIIFVISYGWGIGAKGLASKVKVPSFDPTPGQLLTFAGVLMGIAFALRAAMYVLPFILGVLSYRTAVGLCAISCGFVGWAVGRRMWNPAFMVYGLGIIAVNLGIASLGFSRRPLVAVFAALVWGFYFSYWRYQRPAGVIAKIVAVSIVPILIVASFSSIRESGRADRSVGNIVKRMVEQGDIVHGLRMLSSGDACGPTELWVMENIPGQFEPRHLFTLRFFFMLNIPRAIWPDKPVTLGNLVTTYIRMDGVDRKSHSFGAGIVGYGAGEGGLYAVIIYAFCSAVFLRFFDQILKANVLNPFLVIPLAADMGQLLGMARGDVALFAHTLVTAVLLGAVITLLVAWAIAQRGIPRPPKVKGKWRHPELSAQPAQRRFVTVWVPAEWAARQQQQR